MKKKPVIISLVLAGALALAVFLIQSPVRKGYAGTRSSFNLNAAETAPAPDGYQYSFPLEDTPAGTINCYMLRYRPIDYETAKKYAGMFISADSYHEDDNAYVFAGARGTVTIDKDINLIRYEAAPAMDGGALPRTDEESVQIAADYIQKHLLALMYEEAQVHSDGGSYRVKFINRIGNLKNYAFTNQVTMDITGGVASVDYYAVQYDKVGECRIMSMREAFGELPAVKAGDTVLLSGCQLVYVYEDSIVQPAYYFQGSASGDKTFECFVKAAVYKS